MTEAAADGMTDAPDTGEAPGGAFDALAAGAADDAIAEGAPVEVFDGTALTGDATDDASAAELAGDDGPTDGTDDTAGLGAADAAPRDGLDEGSGDAMVDGATEAAGDDGTTEGSRDGAGEGGGDAVPQVMGFCHQPQLHEPASGPAPLFVLFSVMHLLVPVHQPQPLEKVQLSQSVIPLQGSAQGAPMVLPHAAAVPDAMHVPESPHHPQPGILAHWKQSATEAHRSRVMGSPRRALLRVSWAAGAIRPSHAADVCQEAEICSAGVLAIRIGILTRPSSTITLAVSLVVALSASESPVTGPGETNEARMKPYTRPSI